MKKRKSSWQEKLSMMRILICLSVLHRYASANLITIPKDSEVLIGSLTFFNCSSNSSSSKIQWFHYGIGTKDDRRIIYGYGQFYRSFVNRSRIEGNEAAGVSNLVIEQVSIEDAGKFECQDDMGRGSSGFAQLSVLEAYPVCEWKIENRQETGSGGESTKKLLHLNCTVDFRGNNPPNMTWKRSGDVISQGMTTVNVSPSRVTYMLETSDNFEGQSFQCETTKSVTTQYTCSSDPSYEKNDTVTVPIVVCLVVAVIVVIVVAVLCCRRRKANRRKKRTRQPSTPPTPETKPPETKSPHIPENTSNKLFQQPPPKTMEEKRQGEKQKPKEGPPPPKINIDKREVDFGEAKGVFQPNPTDLTKNDDEKDQLNAKPTSLQGEENSPQSENQPKTEKVESDDETEQAGDEHRPFITKENGSQMENQPLDDGAKPEEPGNSQTSDDIESTVKSVSESDSPEKTEQ